jgi:glycerophosphoryl diester phosphodiesterase
MTLIYGHRGARGERAENTLAGFVHARAVGVAGIETDVALTADYVPVLHHNPALADGQLIRHLSRADLRAAQPDVPDLAEALAAAADMKWLIEIKTFPDQPGLTWPPETIAAAVLAVINKAGLQNPAAILAFDWAVLRAVARLAPAQPRICLTAPQTERERALWWGREVIAGDTQSAVASTSAAGWAAAHETLQAAQIAQAHQLGLTVFAWTVNAPADFARLAPLVDGIITDVPSRFIRPPC